MKTKLIIIILSLLFIITAYNSINTLVITNSIKQDNLENKNKNIQILRDSIATYENTIDSMEQKNLKLNRNIKKEIQNFNPNVSLNTIKNFTETVNYFELNQNKREFKLLLSQILCESRFKQYKAGQILKSNANALGICQIVPNTAYHYLRIMKNSDELYILKDLNCENITKDFNYYLPNNQQIQDITKWLNIEKNNFVLWGYIMKNHLKEKNSLTNSFIAYNAGDGFYNNFIQSGGNPEKFSYVIRINQIANNIKL